MSTVHDREKETQRHRERDRERERERQREREKKFCSGKSLKDVSAVVLLSDLTSVGVFW